MSANRNKESIVLDLKSEDGREALRRLIRRADVLIENLRPGAFDRLGFPTDVLEELNPRLITLSITGFGHDGPEGSRAGYDQIAQGEAGLMSVTGTPDGEPTRIGVPIADVLAGVHGTAGVSAALASREKTGKGMVVRTSLLAAAVSAHTFQGTKWTVGGQVAQRSGNHHPQIAPYGSFRCGDGYVQIAVGSEAIWAKFAPVAGLSADDPGSPSTGTGLPTATRSSPLSKRTSPTAPGPKSSPPSKQPVCLRDRSAPSTRSTNGNKPVARDSSSRSTTQLSGRCNYRVPRCEWKPRTDSHWSVLSTLPLRFSVSTPSRSSTGSAVAVWSTSSTPRSPRGRNKCGSRWAALQEKVSCNIVHTAPHPATDHEGARVTAMCRGLRASGVAVPGAIRLGG